MRQTITSLPLTVYLAISGFFRELKKDEKGLSGVVVAVLLILVAVLAVLVIWAALNGWLEDLWNAITGKAGGIT